MSHFDLVCQDRQLARSISVIDVLCDHAGSRYPTAERLDKGLIILDGTAS